MSDEDWDEAGMQAAEDYGELEQRLERALADLAVARGERDEWRATAARHARESMELRGERDALKERIAELFEGDELTEMVAYEINVADHYFGTVEGEAMHRSMARRALLVLAAWMRGCPPEENPAAVAAWRRTGEGNADAVS